MLLMFRRFSSVALLFAALIAAEPLLHQHPLEQNSIPASCAICATGVGKLPVIMPALSAPQVIAYTLLCAIVTFHAVAVAPSLPSRAPPA